MQIDITANQAHVLCLLVEACFGRGVEAIPAPLQSLEPADIEDAWGAHAAIREASKAPTTPR